MQLNYGPAESLRKAIHNCFSTIKLYYTRGFDHKATYYGYNINICGKVTCLAKVCAVRVLF